MKPYRSILSAAFAVLVLFSSSSFMIGIHLCSGKIQNIALFSEAAGCENEKKLPPCHRQETVPCCQDETVVHDAQDFKSDVTLMSIAGSAAIDVVQPAVILSEIIPSPSISKARYYSYDPPLRSSDLTVSFQVFLI